MNNSLSFSVSTTDDEDDFLGNLPTCPHRDLGGTWLMEVSDGGYYFTHEECGLPGHWDDGDNYEFVYLSGVIPVTLAKEVHPGFGLPVYHRATRSMESVTVPTTNSGRTYACPGVDLDKETFLLAIDEGVHLLHPGCGHHLNTVNKDGLYLDGEVRVTVTYEVDCTGWHQDSFSCDCAYFFRLDLVPE